MKLTADVEDASQTERAVIVVKQYFPNQPTP